MGRFISGYHSGVLSMCVMVEVHHGMALVTLSYPQESPLSWVIIIALLVGVYSWYTYLMWVDERVHN